MASLVASQMSHSVSVKEKGSRNKRKFRTDPPLGEPNNTGYEFSADKFETTAGHEESSVFDPCSVNQDHSNALKLELGLSSPVVFSEVGISEPKEDYEVDELSDADWSDLTEVQLEELLLSNLDTVFKSAIKKIVASGYTEEVATKAILRSGICYGCKDTVSNIVDNTLSLLRNGQETDPSQEHCFEDLVQLEKYILAELICVLQEVRPCFSIGDAMWCLLISDMNVSHACAMDTDPLGSDSTVDGCSSVQPESQSNIEAKDPELTLPSPCKSTSSTERSHLAGCSSVDKPCCNVGTSQSPLTEEKCGSVRKVNSTGFKSDYILRQKSFHVEKSCRRHGSKGSSRGGKASGLSSLILDRKLKSISEATAISLKSASLKISKAMGVDVIQDNLNSNFSSNSLPSNPITVSSDSTDTVSRSTDTLSLLPASDAIPTVTVPTALSATDTDLSLSLCSQSKASTTPICCNNETPNGSCTGILFDKSLGQWIPQDRKDEMILKLIPRVQELQNQIQEWTEWANQKVMQAARRLSKDKAELKTLRQEKDEVERLKKEKQSLEENTMKKLSEMENALRKASRQVERANAAVQKLEVENAMLRREMEAAKLRAAESATSCQEISRREKKTQIKFQSREKQKSLFQEELTTVKRKLAQLQQVLEQAKVQQEQAEARREQATKAKDELLLQASSIRKEREKIEESTKSKEEMIKSKAEIDLQRNNDDIQKLGKEIAQMRLKTDSSKIAALRRGIDGSHNGGYTDMKSSTDMEESKSACISELVTSLSDYSLMVGVKRERECVMCLSEEMSVVFLPCAHQVVCTTCNELHEKQGMQDCPSCRSPIHRRISVRYAHT